MFQDLRAIEPGKSYDFDVCVVGSGAAGLAIATEFLNDRYSVCLLESGGLEIEEDTQTLYVGRNVGAPYFDLDVCRLRFFGGTTNHWAGYCLPFTDHSFAPDARIPHSGWPIRRADIDGHYERAYKFLGIDTAYWDRDYAVAHLRGAPIEPGLGPFEPELRIIRPARPGETLRETIAASDRIHVFLHANALEIVSDETASQVTSIRVAPLQGGESTFRARRYVLAAGGIENARILLNSNRVQAAGLGNANDLVGRYFTDHTWVVAGEIQPVSSGEPFDFYLRQPTGPSQESFTHFRVTEAAQKEFGISESQVRLDPVRRDFSAVAGGESLKALAKGRWAAGDDGESLAAHLGNVLAHYDDLAKDAARRLWYGKFEDVLGVRVSFEPEPNPSSRVTLNETRDALGQRQVDLEWRFTENDRRTTEWVIDAFAKYIGATGLGRFRHLPQADNFEDRVEGVRHHIGTTRMSDDPKTGVVDADCRVHGMSNFFIAGSSVFPTSGQGTPTMLIVALAMRLSDRLKEELA